MMLEEKIKQLEEKVKELERRDHRFWGKVDKRDRSPCWIWTAAEKTPGLGSFTQDGKSISARRWSWYLKHGEPPRDAIVRLKCDQPFCVNPKHMYLGTKFKGAKYGGGAYRKRNKHRQRSL